MAYLTVYGLPKGSGFVYRYAPNYTTLTATITGYTTQIPIYYSNATNQTYGGKIPFQYQGAGTTVTFNNTIYTMYTSGGGTCATQIINVNGSGDFCSFYTFLNQALWTTNEAQELEQANSSLNTAKLIVKQIQNLTTFPQYGSAPSFGLAAGTNKKYAVDNGGDISFINATVQKNTTSVCITVNLAPVPFCSNATTPQRINVPVIGGDFALTGKPYYYLNLTISSTTLKNNPEAFNFSVYDLTNSTYLTPQTTTPQEQSLTFTHSYKIPVSQQVEISAGAEGNANYSKQYTDPITFPANILYYLPITFTNQQTTAVAANTQLMIPFNALAYQSYETSTLNNTEFFYANGTIMPSWIEGNVLNESSKALSTATDVIIWVKSPDTNTFLAANTGTATTNTIYMGFAGTGATTQNMLLSNTITGEAPQLSSTYAEYDDGNSVFTNYWNFAGTSIPSGLTTLVGSPSVDNGVTFTDSAAVITTSKLAYPQIAEVYVYSMSSTSALPDIAEGLTNSACAAGSITDSDYAARSQPAYTYPIQLQADSATCGSTTPLRYSSPISAPYVLGMVWVATGSQSILYNDQIVASSTDSSLTIGDYYVATGQENSGYYSSAYWLRTRAYPPSGVMPSVSFGSITSLPLSASAPTPSAPTIDDGQTITLTASASSGTPPYTYQWYTATSSGTCSTSDTAISGATSSTYTASPTSSTYYCYIVTDSASGTADSPTDLVSVNSALGTPTISPTSATYDAGQTITLTSSVSGGTSPYSYQWYNDTTGTGVAISGATSSTYTATAGSTAGTFKYYVKVTDSAYSHETTTSATESYIVNTALSGGSPTPTTPTIDDGQSITLTANPSGGTTPYSYQWYSGTSSTCTSDTAISGATSSTYTASPTSATYYCYKVTDSATTPTSTYSGTDNVNVNSALGTPTVSPSAATYDAGQTITLTSSVSGGTTPYSYQWYNDTTGTPSAISGATSDTYTATAGSGAGTFKYYVKVTDSAYSPASADSATESYVINTALSGGSPTPSAPTIDDGQSITLTANPSGGTTPYSYQWYGGTSSTCSSDTAISGATSSTYTASPTTDTYYCYKATDSATTPTSALSSTDKVSVNSALGTPSISPTTATIDDGQSVAFTSTWTGGTPDYTAKLYSSSTSTCTSGDTLVQTLSGLSSGSATFSGVSPASTTYYCIYVSDSAYSPETTQSGTSEITVNPALSGTLSSSLTIDDGQSATISVSVSGGTTPYSYQWYTGTACNTAISGDTSSSESVSPSSTTSYSVKVTDSATTPNEQCFGSITITVNPALGTPTISPGSEVINGGQAITFTSTWTGGTHDYTAKLYSSLTSACGSGSTLVQTLSGLTGGSASFSSVTPSQTTYYCITVTDSAYSPETTQSPTSKITIQPNMPNSIFTYMPIVLTNSQGSATVSPFQSDLILNESNTTYGKYIVYNGSVGDFNFYYFNGTQIPAWIESNQSGRIRVWVKTISIPADGSITIYAGFTKNREGTYTNVLSSAAGSTGEAPQLSPSYAEYDDGVYVFNDYWNFASGTPAGWTNSGFGISDGAIGNSGGSTADFLYTNNNFGANVLDWYGYYTSPTLSGTVQTMGFGGNEGAGWERNTSLTVYGYGYYSSPSTILLGKTSVPVGDYQVFSIINTSGSAYYLLNYTKQSGTGTPDQSYIEFYGGDGGTTLIYWARIRATAPLNSTFYPIMPTATLGQPQNFSRVALTFTPSTTITYGQSITITAICSISTDSCAIDYPNSGTVLASGTGSAQYTYTRLGAGTYQYFYANDTTTGVSSTGYTLTVNKAAPALTCTYAGNGVSGGDVVNSLLAYGEINCTAGAGLAATLAYNGVSEGTGNPVAYNAVWNDQNNTVDWSTGGNANYTSGSMGWNLNYIPYVFESASLAGTGYETQNVSYGIVLNITKAAAQAAVNESVNGEQAMGLLEGVGTGPNTFGLWYNVPLLPANDVAYTYNAYLEFTWPGGTYNSLVSTKQQTELWNYYPSMIIDVPYGTNSLLGDNVTINTTISQVMPLNRAGVAGYIRVGDRNLTESVLGNYRYTTRILDFIDSLYGLAMPATGTPTAVSPVSVLNLSFMGQHLYRNVTGSFSSYNISFGACGGDYSQTAITLAFFNASTGASYTGNVLVQGLVNAINGKYGGPNTNIQAAGATPTATSSTYTVCLYPSWAATVQANATLKYNATTASGAQSVVSTYTQVKGAVPTLRLDLALSFPTTPLNYVIFVENSSTLTDMPAFVQSFLYNQITGNLTLINSQKQGSQGGPITLQEGDEYVFKAFTPNGQTFLAQTAPQDALPCSSSVCSVTILVGNFSTSLPQSGLKGLSASCSVSTSGGNGTVTCPWSSTTQDEQTLTLSVAPDGVGAGCTRNETGYAGTLACTVPNVNSTVYSYTLSALSGGAYFQVAIGTFGSRSNSFGIDGVFFAMIIVVALALLFIADSVLMSLIAFGAGFVATALLGLIALPVQGIGFLIFIIAMAVWMVFRGGG